jgi:hypothetical protein
LLLPEIEEELRTKVRERRQAFAAERVTAKAKRRRPRSFGDEVRNAFANLARGLGRLMLPRTLRSILRQAYRKQLTAK